MPMHVHEPAPLNLLSGVDFSVIELIECGIAHPNVRAYVTARDLNTPRYELARTIVQAATGIAFDADAITDRIMNARDIPQYSPWAVAQSVTNRLFEDMPVVVYQRMLVEIREARPEQALAVAQMFFNVVQSLASDPIATMAAD